MTTSEALIIAADVALRLSHSVILHSSASIAAAEYVAPAGRVGDEWSEGRKTIPGV